MFCKLGYNNKLNTDADRVDANGSCYRSFAFRDILCPATLAGHLRLTVPPPGRAVVDARARQRTDSSARSAPCSGVMAGFVEAVAGAAANGQR